MRHLMAGGSLHLVRDVPFLQCKVKVSMRRGEDVWKKTEKEMKSSPVVL